MLTILNNLSNPDWIMAHGGIYIILLILFAETGLLIGFLLPGDTLLFITGIILTNSSSPFAHDALNLAYWLFLMMLSGIAGNFAGYWFGRKSGNRLYQRADSWLFKKKHLAKAAAFYENKGGGAIVLARFLPIVRTFAPIIAGMVRMDPRKFSLYNIIGSMLWVGSLVLAGYFLGDFKWVKDHLEYIMLGIVAITTLPVLIKLILRSTPAVASAIHHKEP